METNQTVGLKPTFIAFISPEILLAHVNVNHDAWVEYESGHFYKIEKKDITLPFQRYVYITDNRENLEISEQEQAILKDLEPHNSDTIPGKLEMAENTIRAILNLDQTTPIENWTQDTDNRTLVEDIIASHHIKILWII
ncbi:hypothetical protein [Acinetobacter sp. A47]|uniref:hypothetical protein n=1 Tax=Acinetobacter sp. A47 TaxID=1561217 RepID=UPI0005701C4D|nr:hypothetical protein [Acinetobacter sp. A47]